ncbi:MAG: DEAD/DEAH box helicase [Patescibacteria group bacterium]|nr:DEAD/DEAH box helicase [Patescibacteria group bacterium]
MPFTTLALRAHADEERLSRGKRYLEEGKVRQLEVDPTSGTALRVTATVHGTRRYRTSVDLDPARNAVIVWSCSCPYDWGGMCKHAVAVGFAFMDYAKHMPEPTPTIQPTPEMTTLLARFLKTNHADVTDKVIQQLASKLALAQMQSGADDSADHHSQSNGVNKPILRMHRLDSIRISIAYDRKTDTLSIKPEALYGPHAVIVGSEETPARDAEDGEETATGRQVVFHIDRDWDAEWFCEQNLRHACGVQPSRNQIFELQGDAIYKFVKYNFQDLANAYEVQIDPTAEHLMFIDEEDVETDWKTSSSGIDFLDFEVDWHCAQFKFSLQQLEEMVAQGKSYIRRDDGSFVNLGNLGDVSAWLDFLKGASSTKDGAFRTKLFRVPEMLHLIENIGASRLTTMDRYVKTFVDEAHEGKPVERVKLPKDLKSVLRPYQERGVEWGVFLQKYHFGGILADDMGLGKTLQALTLLSMPNKTDEPKRPSIVICPKTLIDVWIAEAKNFTPQLRIMAVQGTAAERTSLIGKVQDADVIVTSYPLLLRDIKTYLSEKIEFKYCILDEAQYIKNSESETAQAVKCVSAAYRLALTGTPFENGVHELWSIFDFLMPGFLSDKKTFRTRYQRPIQENKNNDAIDSLRAKIRPFILRRTKTSELKDLPPKIEQIRTCALTPEQLVLYTQTMEAVRRDVFTAVERKGFKRSQIEILTALMRLRQICNHPALVLKQAKRDPDLSGKMPTAMEIIDEAIEGGHKVLLFSAFTSMLDIIRTSLDDKKIGHCTIEGKTNDRAKQIKIFNEDPNTHIFLLSLKAGGVGLTLTAADTVILFDPWWNPMAENQAADRAHRIGQRKTVNVYKLITKGTIEERVLALQDRKRKLFDALMAENGEALGALTWDDIKGLFEEPSP